MMLFSSAWMLGLINGFLWELLTPDVYARA